MNQHGFGKRLESLPDLLQMLLGQGRGLMIASRYVLGFESCLTIVGNEIGGQVSVWVKLVVGEQTNNGLDSHGL
jgi:hypothetical protein